MPASEPDYLTMREQSRKQQTERFQKMRQRLGLSGEAASDAKIREYVEKGLDERCKTVERDHERQKQQGG